MKTKIIVALTVMLIGACCFGSFSAGMAYKELIDYREAKAARLIAMENNSNIFMPRMGEPLGKAVKVKK